MEDTEDTVGSTIHQAPDQAPAAPAQNKQADNRRRPKKTHVCKVSGISRVQSLPSFQIMQCWDCDCGRGSMGQHARHVPNAVHCTYVQHRADKLATSMDHKR
jgi:hypothetical protein